MYTAAPEAPEGSVDHLNDWSPIPGRSSAILCRNNAPLVKMAFKLLRRQVPINFLGRDIGSNLKRLYTKLSNKGKRGMPEVITKIGEAMEKGQDEYQTDKYASLLEILQAANGDLDGALEFLSKPASEALVLSTGHRAKGLEFPNVYHLEPQLIPSKHASTDSELRQEKNLRYVIETRTQKNLMMVRQEALL
jgi:superfamily I DNA/RNA helicase